MIAWGIVLNNEAFVSVTPWDEQKPANNSTAKKTNNVAYAHISLFPVHP